MLLTYASVDRDGRSGGGWNQQFHGFDEGKNESIPAYLRSHKQGDGLVYENESD